MEKYIIFLFSLNLELFPFWFFFTQILWIDISAEWAEKSQEKFRETSPQINYIK